MPYPIPVFILTRIIHPSQRPYQGSIQTNGAFLVGGDHKPTTGAVKVSERYGRFSTSNKSTRLIWLSSKINVSISNVWIFNGSKPSASKGTGRTTSPTHLLHQRTVYEIFFHIESEIPSIRLIHLIIRVQESRMSADLEMHRLISRILHTPKHLHLIALQTIPDLQKERERIALSVSGYFPARNATRSPPHRST